MAIDLTLALACTPKLHLGEGDANVGAERLLTMLKSRARGLAAYDQATRDGVPAEHAPVAIVVWTPSGPEERMTTVGALLAEATPLEALSVHCARCPARMFDAAFGCFGAVGYPIPRAAEGWLLSLVEPADRLGGIVCRSAIHDFAWNGAPVAEMRAHGMFESRAPLQRDLGGGVVITSDQLFEPVFGIGTALEPTHCVIYLSWFGAVTIDGQALGGADKSALRPLLALPPMERATRTSLLLPPAPPEAFGIDLLLRAAYVAWVTETRLTVAP